MKIFWMAFALVLCSLNQVAFSGNRIMMQAVKLDPIEFGQERHVLYTSVSVDGSKACYFKGPNMAEYQQGVWSEGHGHWYYELPFISLSQLQIEFLGIYMVNVIGPLEDAMFLPVPALIEPEYNASNVIAEHCTFTWDSNMAESMADDLWVVIAGDSFFYLDSTLDLTSTSWSPGWLEIGDAFCRLSYVDYRFDMISEPDLVSGTEIIWNFYMTCLLSSDKHNFSVKYSLDFNEDDIINLEDMVIFFTHWLEQKQ